jgi:ABC-type transporter Mla maintaining outer membrane lipid asymmetry ATPase subunit MlaF
MNQNAPVEDPIIELRDVAISSVTGETRGIQWNLLPGEYWVIGGLHGASRSDFLATATGLHRPREGMVRIYGKDITDLKEKDLREDRLRIGMVFQGGGRLFHDLTVAENVALPLRYHNDWSFAEGENEVQAIIEMTGLQTFASKSPASLSLSWQQRVGLARALALRPEVLLLEKPLAGLEVRHRRWWLDFLDKLRAGTFYPTAKPLAIAVTTDDLQPWLTRGQQFAALLGEQWRILGGAEEVKAIGGSVTEFWAKE